MKYRLPRSYHNLTSYAGTAIALIGLFMFIFLYVLASLAKAPKAYEGIIIFMVIPVFIVLGLILIPVGMWRTSRKHLRAGTAPREPVIDLNKPSTRNAAVIFVVGTLVFLFLSALGSYKAYHYTESILFCGRLCHTVMHPEYTAYQTSPHARVSCAQCHVGPGASWYVKSKLSGLYQVYATLTNRFPPPIPAPIKSLRPARETCEECHWPQKVYGKQQILQIHYLTDKANTRWNIDMRLNTGAGNQALGFRTGIHWHINRDIRIEYFPTDRQREDIARVILTNTRTGERTIFNSPEGKAGGAELEKFPPRFMDCIDCHNCPSHIYRSPLEFINLAIAEGQVDPSLPFIKKTAAEACLKIYPTTPAAHRGIADKIRKFYADAYPGLLRDGPGPVEASIRGTIRAFDRNIFPEMKARWDAYPNHIGHLDSPGCFRCHDGRHTSASGAVIRHDCTLCHSILGQGPAGRMTFSLSDASLAFRHPVDIGQAWKEMACVECHSSPPL
jgi:fumarate reductase subunit C